MPITSIISQPSSSSLNAAYRPVIVICGAEQTSPVSDRFIPPVVYCDIYFDGVYYKSLSSTQPENIPVFGTTPARFKFDLQDACQEFLVKQLAARNHNNIDEVEGIMVVASCKLRSSTVDSSGFTVPEGTAPIQATGSNAAVAGTGTASNSFIVVNATLQHEDNQSLADHLNSFKQRAWSNLAFPLTHRPEGYRICKNDSDVFPIIYLDTKMLKCIRLVYKPKGSADYYEAVHCYTGPPPPPCVPAAGSISLPNATVDVAYNYVINLTGTAPFTITGQTKPSWMTVSLVGSTITLGGTPTSGDVASEVVVSITIYNACGNVTLSDNIDIAEAPVCTPVDFSTVLPDGEVGVIYYWSVPISGTSPFILSSLIKPSWMNISVSGSNVIFSGTPDVEGTGIAVSFTLSNCSGASTTSFSDSIDVEPSMTGHNSLFINYSVEAIIDDVTPYFYFITSANVMPLAPGQTIEGDHGNWSSAITVTERGDGTLKLYKNAILMETIVCTGLGPTDYIFSPVSFLFGDQLKITLD